MSPRLSLPRLRRKAAADMETQAATELDQAVSSAAASGTAEVSARAGDPIAAAPSATPAKAVPSAPEEPDATEDGADATDVGRGLALLAAYERAVLSWVEEDGYPINVDVEIEVRPADRAVRFTGPAGFQIPPGTPVAITASHIRVLPEGGFDERRHVTVWGAAGTRPRGRFAVSPERAWAWDERDMPLPVAYERRLPKARRYYEELSAERGEPIRPRVSTAMLLVRATRAPFLSATFAPVLLGLAVAARTGVFDPVTALITLIAASAVHLGLNVANDVFDTLQGADDANTTPTKFSGGSRVLQNALVTIREMSMIAAGCYGVALGLGLILLILRGSPELVAIAVLGLFISVAYTMPPFKLVYRGLGEISTAIGFGPVMLLGTYAVQSRGSLTVEALLVSLPVALFVALILYVNEIPDRAGDAKVGKRTLPVRWSKSAVIRGFDASAAGAFVIVAAGAALGLLPLTTLLMLLAIPLAMRVHAGLVRFYDSPYGLMDSMGANIRLHMMAGLLLLSGYLLAMADQAFLHMTPFLW
jgi:1,4-dihydroxy-2-naphthoate octaprenyltransferase